MLEQTKSERFTYKPQTHIYTFKNRIHTLFSLPGVIVNGILVLMPALSAYLQMLAALDISSYEELVQLPIRAIKKQLKKLKYSTNTSNIL